MNKAHDKLSKALHYYKTADFAQARELAEAVIRDNPSDLGCVHLLALIAKDTNDASAACNYFNRMIAIKPDSPVGYEALGQIYIQLGDYEQAYQVYTKLINSDLPGTNIALARTNLTICLSHITAKHYDVAMEKDLLFAYSCENINIQHLSTLTAQLLCRKYQWIPQSGYIAFTTDIANKFTLLIDDELFLHSLENLYFTHPVMEKLLIVLRKHLLMTSMTTMTVNDDYLRLINAIAIHSNTNEYLYDIDEQEQEILTILLDLIEKFVAQPMWQPGDVAALLLLTSMYNSPHNLPFAAEFARFPLEQWPHEVKTVVELTLFAVFEEHELIKTIPSLTIISDDVSTLVRSQYEENPYPRWTKLFTQRKVSVYEYMRENTINYEPPAFLNDQKVRILVAGCGTGKQPLVMASTFTNAEITAIDISKRSLAYAMQKAKQYNLSNIEFYHADILELGSFDKKFHFIASSGVLHHMQEPSTGWAILKNLLVPGGIMLVALYSELARKSVVAARQIINKLNIGTTADDIRRFRAALMTDQMDSNLAQLVLAHDFYNLSGCRDLLFHFHEHRFTIPQLEKLLPSLQLRFIGFNDLDSKKLCSYANLYPDDVTRTNLTHWHQFECQNPNTFAGMYEIWCQTLN